MLTQIRNTFTEHGFVIVYLDNRKFAFTPNFTHLVVKWDLLMFLQNTILPLIYSSFHGRG